MKTIVSMSALARPKLTTRLIGRTVLSIFLLLGIAIIARQVEVASPERFVLVLYLSLLSVFGFYRLIEAILVSSGEGIRTDLMTASAVIKLERIRLKQTAELVRSGQFARDQLTLAYPSEMAEFSVAVRHKRFYFVAEDDEQQAGILVSTVLKNFGFNLSTFSMAKVSERPFTFVSERAPVLVISNRTAEAFLSLVRRLSGMYDANLAIHPMEEWLEDPRAAYPFLKELIPPDKKGFETAVLGVILSIIGPYLPRPTSSRQPGSRRPWLNIQSDILRALRQAGLGVHRLEDE